MRVKRRQKRGLSPLSPVSYVSYSSPMWEKETKRRRCLPLSPVSYSRNVSDSLGIAMPSYDAQAVKEAVNLVDLAGADTQLRRLSGDEHAGPCPKCGGDDRFHVTPEWWFCRQCHERRGDAIEYLRWKDGLSFPDACEALGGQRTATSGPRTGNTRRTAPPAVRIPTTAAPGDLWQTAGRALVATCEAELWRQPDKLAYLRGRGLRDDTIRAAHLGWSWGYKRPPERWGLDPAKYPSVKVARGWTIPCEVGGQLRYVKVRLSPEDLAAWKARLVAQGKDNEEPPKYLCVAGGPTAGVVYGLDDAQGATDVVLCEGEINALMLGQALEGVAVAVSVGSASSPPPGADALRVLARVPRPWAAYDHDAAGERGASKMTALWARVRRLSWPWGDRGDKYDIADAGRDGEDLAAWCVPQLGPQEPDRRRTWLEHHLQRLDDAALEAGADDTDPALRVWLALWGELEALGPDPARPRRRAAQSVANRNVAPGSSLVGFPTTSATSQQAAPRATKGYTGGWNPPRPAGDPAWPSDPDWPGPGWEVCAAPSWAALEAPHHRRWATNGAGRWVSGP